MKTNKIFIILTLCFTCILFAQKKIKTIDTLKVIPTEKDLDPKNNLNKSTVAELKKNQENHFNNQLVRKQNFIFEAIENEIQNAERLLKIGIDYKEFTTEFNTEVDLKKSATIDITNNTDNFLTYRNLTVTTLIFNEISDRIVNQLKKINGNNQSLSYVQNKLDSLFTAKELYNIPTDSLSKIIYINRYMTIDKDYKNINGRLKNALDSIQKIQI
jgi:potassium efflux system protein